ncbi:hypothetical protein [Agrobacterium rosae]|uniref:hypothetical protein n=1 Tax=Agrobacterium rosae TaxID=1972867 RepID=UPI0012963FE1|nr:hypothetical protein [Agrobacterium rosae]MCM2434685.1 hypothetical protein [Agrobacterium rosae]
MPLPASALPGISPTGGEIGWALAHRFDRIFIAKPLPERMKFARGYRESISPPVGEMPGRAEGGELAPALNALPNATPHQTLVIAHHFRHIEATARPRCAITPQQVQDHVGYGRICEDERAW